MRIFATRSAWKQALKCRLTREHLIDTSDRTNAGLIDAKIGAHLYKQHAGRRGDFRVILYHVRDERSVVIHIFPKNVQPNISGKELEALRDFVGLLNDLSDDDYVKAARERGWKDLSDEKSEEDVPKRPPAIDP